MQYFTEKQDDVIIDTTRFETVSKATYSDSLIWEEIKAREVDKLFACSVQMAVVGFGNKELGEVMFDGAEISVKDYLSSVGVNCEMTSGANLDENVLTPRRLIRAFRFHIQEYLSAQDLQTYLFKKYNSDACDASYVFPGAEYLITTLDHASDLLVAYENLDNRQNTNVYKRAVQVFKARGIEYE
jgi:hypothetical protein